MLQAVSALFAAMSLLLLNAASHAIPSRWTCSPGEPMDVISVKYIDSCTRSITALAHFMWRSVEKWKRRTTRTCVRLLRISRLTYAVQDVQEDSLVRRPCHS